MSQFIRGAGMVTVTLPTGNTTLEELISHVDYQLGTDFGMALAQLCDESFSQGRLEMQKQYLNVLEPTAAVSQDHCALRRIANAEDTGYVPV